MSVAQTKLEDCADTYVAVAKNTSLTGQEIQVGEETLMSPLSLVGTNVMPFACVA